MTDHSNLCFDVQNPRFYTYNVRDAYNNITSSYLPSIYSGNCGITRHTSIYYSARRKNNHIKTIKTVKHILIHEPELKPILNLCNHLKFMNPEPPPVLEEELPPITAIKWGIGFVGNSDISLTTHSWADEVDRSN